MKPSARDAYLIVENLLRRHRSVPAKCLPCTPAPSVLCGLLSLCLLLGAFSCNTVETNGDADPPPSRVNFAHLDHLGEDVSRGASTYRIVHIYSETPDYGWVPDPVEGAACVDDAARAAVVYLRHFELTEDESSREKAEALIRFIMYMQRDDGLFYNFVYSNRLDINTDHQNSRAEPFGWWAARGVWALGMCARVLSEDNPSFADACARRVDRSLPQIEKWLEEYPRTTTDGNRTMPRWLLYEHASDASSELLLGLAAMQKARPSERIAAIIDRLSEGIALMQYGSMNQPPWSAHASWVGLWHGWGNSQTQALSETGRLQSAVREAEHFYPRILVDGWAHSFPLDDPTNIRRFEQIAYAVRATAVGLIRLFEATGDERFAQMAGLAASWFTGNNVAQTPMYDEKRGFGFDGINGPSDVNRNAGAESTIEALFTLMEVERHPQALKWLDARSGEPIRTEKNGNDYYYRVYTTGSGTDARRIAVIMNLTDETLNLLEDPALAAWLGG